jgi:hypothetical protein
MSKMFKRVIERLAAREGIDLWTVGSYAKFEMAGYQDLCLEVIGPGLIAVAHTFVQNGDLMFDPEIVFSMTTGEGWAPVEITQHPVGNYQRVAEVGHHGQITHLNVRVQRSVSQFAGVWARDLQAQGWQHRATCARKEHGEGQTVPEALRPTPAGTVVQTAFC